MGMNVGSGSAKGADPEPMMEMNMTPLIDVLLVLIIMLTLWTSHATAKALENISV